MADDGRPAESEGKKAKSTTEPNVGTEANEEGETAEATHETGEKIEMKTKECAKEDVNITERGGETEQDGMKSGELKGAEVENEAESENREEMESEIKEKKVEAEANSKEKKAEDQDADREERGKEEAKEKVEDAKKEGDREDASSHTSDTSSRKRGRSARRSKLPYESGEQVLSSFSYYLFQGIILTFNYHFFHFQVLTVISIMLISSALFHYDRGW